MYKDKKGFLLDVLAVLVGAPLIAGGMVTFTIPNHLAPGGVSGLATALAEILPISIGVLSLLINIPIFIIAWRMFGTRQLLMTGLAAVCFSLLLDILTPYLPTYTGNRLLAAAFGGAFMGVGMGILFTRGVTTGGTDLITMILRKPFPQLQAGSLLIFIDAVVVVLAVILFRDIEVALYSTITIYVQGKVIDAIMQGVDYAKVVMIITDKPEEIRSILVDDMGRGLTEFTVKGGYTRDARSLLMSVARRSEVAKTLKVAKSVDPAAFIILHNATEVHGEGFKEDLL